MTFLFNDFGKADADDKDDEDDKAHLYSAVVLSRFRASGEAILGTQRYLYVRLQYVSLCKGLQYVLLYNFV